MSRIEWATYQLSTETIQWIQEALSHLEKSRIKLQELTSVDEVKTFIQPTESLICRLLIVEGNHLNAITSDIDVSQPLVILQLWDVLADIEKTPAWLATCVTIASVKAELKEIITILRRMLDEVASRWEQQVRHQIQSAYDDAYFSSAYRCVKTSLSVQLFLDKIKAIIQATSLTLGCVTKKTDKFNIIYKTGQSNLILQNFQPQAKAFQEDNQIEARPLCTEQISYTNIPSHQQCIAFECSFLDSQDTCSCLLYEFESVLPTQVLLDVSNTATRELRRLQEHFESKAISDFLKVLVEAQRKLPDEDQAQKLVLQYFQQYFDAQGASILRITDSRQDEKVLELKKTFMHYETYEKVLIPDTDHGYAHHCVTKRVALLIERTEDPLNKKRERALTNLSMRILQKKTREKALVKSID